MTTFDEAAQRLNCALYTLEEALESRYHITAKVPLTAGSDLWWGKKGKRWTLFVVTGDYECLLAESSLQTRLLAIEHIYDLRTALEKRGGLLMEDLEKASDLAARHTDELLGLQPPELK